MIEAVNATVSNTQLIRSVAEQTSSTQVLSANPARVQSAAIVAPYLSPHVDLNGGQSKPIFVVRDAATGSQIKQFPTEAQIRAYQRAQEVRGEIAATQQDTGGEFAARQRSADIAKSSVEFRQIRQEIKQHQDVALPGQKQTTTTRSAETKSFGGSSQSSRSLTVDTEV